MNKCAHPDCNEMKPREHYACKRHWFTLPARIQVAINKGYHGGGDWWGAHKEAQSYWESRRRMPGLRAL